MCGLEVVRAVMSRLDRPRAASKSKASAVLQPSAVVCITCCFYSSCIPHCSMDTDETMKT